MVLWTESIPEVSMTVKQRLILLVSAASAGLIFLAVMGAVQMNRVFTAANYGNENSVPSLLTLEEAFRPMAAARPIIWQYFYATPAERPVLEARIFALQEDVDKAFKKYEATMISDEGDREHLQACMQAVANY